MSESKQARFPSAEFPELPALTMAIPEGWAARQVPGTLLAVVLDRGPGAFSPNIVITLTRGTQSTWEQAEAAVDEYAAGLQDVETAPRERVVLGERRWSVLEFAHVIPEAGTVFQTIATTLVDRGPVFDLIRATSTVTPDVLDATQPQVRAAIGSIRITER